MRKELSILAVVNRKEILCKNSMRALFKSFYYTHVSVLANKQNVNNNPI